MKSTKFYENIICGDWYRTLLAVIWRFWNFDVEVYYFTEMPTWNDKNKLFQPSFPIFSCKVYKKVKLEQVLALALGRLACFF